MDLDNVMNIYHAKTWLFSSEAGGVGTFEF